MTFEQTVSTLQSASPNGGRPAIASRRFLHLEDFSSLADEPFIEAAYWVALRRPPDSDDKDVQLHLLAAGISKAEILNGLVHSPEGRLIGAHIHGLAGAGWRARMHRYPGVGALMRLGDSWWPFAQSRRNLTVAFQRLAHIEEQAEARARQADEDNRNAHDAIERVRVEFGNALLLFASADSVASLRAAVAEAGERLRLLQDQKADVLETRQLRDSVAGEINALRGTLDGLEVSKLEKSAGDAIKNALPFLASNDSVALLRAALAEAGERLQLLQDQKADVLETRQLRDSVAGEINALRGKLDGLEVSKLEKSEGDAIKNALPFLASNDSVALLRAALAEAGERLQLLQDQKADVLETRQLRDSVAGEINALRGTLDGLEVSKLEKSAGDAIKNALPFLASNDSVALLRAALAEAGERLQLLQDQKADVLETRQLRDSVAGEINALRGTLDGLEVSKLEKSAGDAIKNALPFLASNDSVALLRAALAEAGERLQLLQDQKADAVETRQLRDSVAGEINALRGTLDGLEVSKLE